MNSRNSIKDNITRRKHDALNRDRVRRENHESYLRNAPARKLASHFSSLARKKRIVSWSETAAIREFYRACPPGYHVDHQLPLQGKYISGLHVLANLQYLLAEENFRKGRGWRPE